jgi:hypothetical protein
MTSAGAYTVFKASNVVFFTISERFSLINGFIGKVLPEDYPQNTTTCVFSITKFILIPIIALFIFLFSLDFLREKFKSLRGIIWTIVINNIL